MTYSVYSVAKTFCEKKNWKLSNLSLNKLVYLAHMLKLGKTDGREGLVRNAFEAWDYGPVSPALYHKAKVFGSSNVGNIFHQYEAVKGDDDLAIIQEVLEGVGDMTPGQLVAITHMVNGGWHRNYEPGVRGAIIPDEDILEEYNLRVSRQPEPAPVQRCAECDCDNPPDGCTWIKAGPDAPVSVQEAARVLAEKLEAPFENADMNARDIDWQKVWADFWEEASERDAPAAMCAALRAIAEGKSDV